VKGSALRPGLAPSVSASSRIDGVTMKILVAFLVLQIDEVASVKGPWIESNRVDVKGGIFGFHRN
jgi:hypothetical protein